MLVVQKTYKGRAAVAPRVWQAVFAKTLRIARHGAADATLIIVDGRTMRSFNKRYRGKDAVTDVLSFAAREGEVPPGARGDYLGEVILCHPRIVSQARAFDTSVVRESIALFVHGVLHLLGHDHQRLSDFKRMHALERRILKTLGYEAL